jgi:rhodanese-related sulfurtransferase
MVALVILGTAVGFAYNAASPNGIPVKGGKQAILEQQGTRMLTTDEVKYYRDQPGTVILDARSAEEYQLGHVAGAGSLPDDKFEQAFPRLEGELRKASLIIIYCSGGSCGTSEEVAKKLREKGIKNLAIDTDGLPGWMRAKLPIRSGPER